MARAAPLRKALTDHLIGVIHAALGGSIITALGFAPIIVWILRLHKGGTAGWVEEITSIGLMAVFIFFFAWVAFALGAVVLGAPLYWLLARLGQANRIAGAIVGALVCGAAAAMIFDSGQTLDLAFMAIVAAAGGLAGLLYTRSRARRP